MLLKYKAHLLKLHLQQELDPSGVDSFFVATIPTGLKATKPATDTQWVKVAKK